MVTGDFIHTERLNMMLEILFTCRSLSVIKQQHIEKLCSEMLLKTHFGISHTDTESYFAC